MLPWSSDSPSVRLLLRRRRPLALFGFLSLLLSLCFSLTSLLLFLLSPAQAHAPFLPSLCAGAHQAVQSLTLTSLACWREIPVLLRGHPKPSPRFFLPFSLSFSLLGIPLAISLLSSPITPPSAPFPAIIGAAQLASSSFASLLLFLTWAVEIETHKSPHARCDSLLLHYARCLCWSQKTRRCALAGTPVYAATAAGAVLCVGTFAGQSAGTCAGRERAYVGGGAGLLAVYSVVVSWAWTTAERKEGRRRWWTRKWWSKAVVGMVVMTSVAWGAAGKVVVGWGEDGACQGREERSARMAWAMHALMAGFGATLLAASVVCKVEAVLFDYYWYEGGERTSMQFTQGFHQMVLNGEQTPRGYLSDTDIDEDAETDGESVHGQYGESKSSQSPVVYERHLSSSYDDVNSSDALLRLARESQGAVETDRDTYSLDRYDSTSNGVDDNVDIVLS